MVFLRVLQEIAASILDSFFWNSFFENFEGGQLVSAYEAILSDYSKGCVSRIESDIGNSTGRHLDLVEAHQCVGVENVDHLLINRQEEMAALTELHFLAVLDLDILVVS
jgi:hypothetical protein